MARHSKQKAPTPKAKKQAKSIHDYKPGAPAHGALVDTRVHVFVDDQNLFYGITNRQYGAGFRIDFGRLLLEACRVEGGQTRVVGSAYIAGVIPDNDTFWEIAKNRGFQVRRGYLGSNNRSKQDDAYLITDMVSTLFEQPGPSTIVLIAGDADYVPSLSKSISKGWRNEVVFVDHGISTSLERWFIPSVSWFHTTFNLRLRSAHKEVEIPSGDEQQWLNPTTSSSSAQAPAAMSRRCAPPSSASRRRSSSASTWAVSA